MSRAGKNKTSSSSVQTHEGKACPLAHSHSDVHECVTYKAWTLLLHSIVHTFITSSLQCVISLWIISHTLLHHFPPSRPACLCTISLSSSSLHHSLSLPEGHPGQAWCCGRVDKYHVSRLHVFSGRGTVICFQRFTAEQLSVRQYSKCIYIF